MNRRPRALVIPYPAQGHIRPLMNFSYWIAHNGINVTFVLPQSVHDRVLAAMPEKNAEHNNSFKIVSLPDGLESGVDLRDPAKKTEAMLRVMSSHLENLIKRINLSDHEQVNCVIADSTIGWVMEIAEKMGIKRALFWPSTVSCLALSLRIPKLIEDGVLDECGNLKKNDMIQLSPNIPPISRADFPWNYLGDPVKQASIFQMGSVTRRAMRISNWILCNSFYELDPLACDLIPNLLPVGPMPSSNSLGQPAGNFWPEDSTCLSWLDQQPTRSVIYIAFGSTTIFNQDQFDELALALELVGQPFLWVVRSNLIKGSVINYPDGFTERIADFGKIIEWAPQDKVLTHPSTGCFLTHCGWNSTMEGLTAGVPFLCWPYFADQLLIRSYISDVWKVGLRLIPEESGIILRHEIKKKMENLLFVGSIRENALQLKEIAQKSANEGGSSFNNFKTFVEQLHNFC